MKYTIPSVEEMLKAGVHFGHQIKRWNPKTIKYVYEKDNKSHIIDLYKTQELLEKACDFLYEKAKNGEQIVFVGTKRQASKVVKDLAIKANALYISERWLGGTLTNYNSIASKWKKLDQMITDRSSGKYDKYTKKEKLLMSREIAKLENLVGGIRGLSRKPGVVVLVDVKKELTAVREARFIGTPIVAILDTNSDPDLVDYAVPGNDDAIKSITMLMTVMADAVKAGYADFSKVVKEVKKEVKIVEKVKEVKKVDAEVKKEEVKKPVKKVVASTKKVAAKKTVSKKAVKKKVK